MTGGGGGGGGILPADAIPCTGAVEGVSVDKSSVAAQALHTIRTAPDARVTEPIFGGL